MDATSQPRTALERRIHRIAHRSIAQTIRAESGRDGVHLPGLLLMGIFVSGGILAVAGYVLFILSTF